MMLGFSGYLIFGERFWDYSRESSLSGIAGLIIGCAYDRIVAIIPLFVIL